MPELGYVDVPEDEYARLYDQLSSSDSEQVQEAMSSLRKIKALEEAEVEAMRRGPERTEPDDTHDLSEPIFFNSPSRVEIASKAALLKSNRQLHARLRSGTNMSRSSFTFVAYFIF